MPRPRRVCGRGHGLDRPLPVRYAAWLGSVARGEFGYSLAYNGAVGPLLRQRIPGTLLLTVTATLLAWLVALPLGVWNAAGRGSGAIALLRQYFLFCYLSQTFCWQLFCFQLLWKRAGFRPGECIYRGPERCMGRSDSAMFCGI